MAPYFSMDCSFDNKKINPYFVKNMYSLVFQNGFPFKSGYTKYDKLPLDDIIQWNQEKLEQGFIVGGSQHYKFDYKQILFDSLQYKHMRGFWRYRKDESTFSIIVHESDVLQTEGRLDFIESKIEPLRKLAVSLWENKMVDAIQTSTENGGQCSLKAIKAGEGLVDIPFAIINNEAVRKFDVDFFHKKKLVPIENNGILIFNPDPESFITYWRNKCMPDSLYSR